MTIHLCFHGNGEIIARRTTGGRIVRWEFDRRFGPTFLDRDGMALERQPMPGSQSWALFKAWLADQPEEA